jgi:hypothetical protein
LCGKKPKQQKIAKVALVVLINSGEKLVLTQDLGPGRDADLWKGVALEDPMTNEAAGLRWGMK